MTAPQIGGVLCDTTRHGIIGYNFAENKSELYRTIVYNLKRNIMKPMKPTKLLLVQE
jgi:hypothetical protein